MMLKRSFDILVSVLCFIFIIPFTPFIVAAILIEDRGPVFVRLPRVSEGKIIQVYKFRSMIVGARNMKKDLEHLNERDDGPFLKLKTTLGLQNGKVFKKI